MNEYSVTTDDQYQSLVDKLNDLSREGWSVLGCPLYQDQTYARQWVAFLVREKKKTVAVTKKAKKK